MPNYRDYESLRNVLDAHHQAIDEANRQDRLRRAAAGKKLLAIIVKPCTGARKPAYFNSSVVVHHLRGKNYGVRADVPLQPTTVNELPTSARLILTGKYRTLALKRQGHTLQEDPLQCLVPQTADLTVVFSDLKKPQIVTPLHWATFNTEMCKGEATGFMDPHSGQQLSLGSNHYAGVVDTLKEAISIQNAACGNV